MVPILSWETLILVGWLGVWMLCILFSIWKKPAFFHLKNKCTIPDKINDCENKSKSLKQLQGNLIPQQTDLCSALPSKDIHFVLGRPFYQVAHGLELDLWLDLWWCLQWPEWSSSFNIVLDNFLMCILNCRFIFICFKPFPKIQQRT